MARVLPPVGVVVSGLARQVQRLCAELLPDGHREGAEWVAPSRWGGSTRSLSVHLSGPKAGVWADFAADKRGDALRLVAELACNGDTRRALAWARRWLGLGDGSPSAIRTQRLHAETEACARAAADEADEERRRRYAHAIWLAGKPLADTPAESYLRGRGIDLRALGRQPGALRFHPSLWHAASRHPWPAMVAAVSDAEGRHIATHRTWLEALRDGQVRKAPISPNKAVLGSFRGGSIRLWRGASGRSLRDALPGEVVDVTEGIEDGLSVAMAVPECRILAAISLSNLANLRLPRAITTLRLWRQNDTHAAAVEAFDRAVADLAGRGRDILIAEVPSDVKDVNELLIRAPGAACPV